MKRLSMKIFGTVLLCCCLYPALVAGAGSRMLVDQTGVQVEIPVTPRRVLSLAPSITEMIYSLAAEQSLLGATRFSNYPPAARFLPRIGSYVQLDLEKIVAMKPDLCLAIKDGNPRRTVDAIKDFGIPVFAIDPRNIEQIKDTFLTLGDILGVSKRAEAVVADIDHRLMQVKNRVAASRTRPRVFFQISYAPIISAGRNSYIDQLIALAGGRNVAGDLPGYPRFSWENLLLLQPEVVLISSMTGEKSPEMLKTAWQQWREIPAVRNNQLHIVDADLFNRPTLRLIDGLEILARILHPDFTRENTEENTGENGAK